MSGVNKAITYLLTYLSVYNASSTIVLCFSDNLDDDGYVAEGIGITVGGLIGIIVVIIGCYIGCRLNVLKYKKRRNIEERRKGKFIQKNHHTRVPQITSHYLFLKYDQIIF